jgi:hypothetical protein
MALILPGSDSSVKDGAQVGLAATAATLLVLPWIGGWGSLSAWLLRALPANLDIYLVHGSNLSISGPVLPVAFVSTLYVTATVLVAFQRRRWPRESWPLLGAVVILAVTPLVWPQYWLALIAVILMLAKNRSFQWALMIVLVMAWPLAENTGAMVRVTSYLGVLLLVVSLFAGSIPGGDDQASRFNESPAGSSS